MLGRNVGIEPIADRSKLGSSEIALEQVPHARLEAAIAGLVVPLPKAREDAEDPRVALSGECPIGALQRLALPRRCDIAIDHCALDFLGNITPRVLQNRSEIVGRMARQRVLEIEQAEMTDALPPGDEHDV